MATATHSRRGNNMESLNERLDRIELNIAELKEIIGRFKPASISKKEVIDMLDDLQQGLKPAKAYISKNEVYQMLNAIRQELKPVKVEIDVNKEVKSIVTRDFVTKLYRG